MLVGCLYRNLLVYSGPTTLINWKSKLACPVSKPYAWATGPSGTPHGIEYERFYLAQRESVGPCDKPPPPPRPV